LKPNPHPNGLSLRANNCLAKAGIPIDKDTILRLLQTGKLAAFIWPPAYGKKTHAELCHWAGLDPSSL
jgi:hypothetical protein